MKEDNNSNRINNLAKLTWACRRGMLELDVLLGNFLKNAYPELADADKLLFVQLLECSDPELFAWLLGQETPSDTDLLRIINLVRKNAQSRV